jgi:hypothetical protein
MHALCEWGFEGYNKEYALYGKNPCTVNLAPAQSHIWHMMCKICFTIILCWLHLRRIWHTMCQENGESYLTHVKQNMLHMWLIVLHLRQLYHIVCHIWICAGTDLQCIGVEWITFGNFIEYIGKWLRLQNIFRIFCCLYLHFLYMYEYTYTVYQ